MRVDWAFLFPAEGKCDEICDCTYEEVNRSKKVFPDIV